MTLKASKKRTRRTKGKFRGPAVESRGVDLAALGVDVPTPGRKYRNEPCVVDGIRFASRREARRYGVLRLLEIQGDIAALETHPSYALTVNGVVVGRYTADFRYLDRRSRAVVVEDTKGFRTRDYALRKKLMLAIHGVAIREV